MIAFVLPLLLDLATIELPQSQLVAAEHKHEWSVIFQDDKRLAEMGFIDRAPTRPYSDGSREYGTVLIRAVEEKLEGGVYMIDLLIALDCDAAELAFVDVWEPEPDAGGPKWSNFKIGEFTRASNDEGDEAARDAMFKQVCGPDWEFGPPQ